MDETFIDIRDQLPNNNEEVLFVVVDNEVPIIVHGVFKVNSRMDFWIFQSFIIGREFEKGSVFKWKLAPKFSIVTDLYPKGKEISLKYCRYEYTKFENRFFEDKRSMKMGAPEIVTTGEGSEEKFQEALERHRQTIKLIPFCSCGAKGLHRTQKTKMITVKNYPVTVTEHKCQDCLEKNR